MSIADQAYRSPVREAPFYLWLLETICSDSRYLMDIDWASQPTSHSFTCHLLGVLDKLNTVNQANGTVILNVREVNPEKKTVEPVNNHYKFNNYQSVLEV